MKSDFKSRLKQRMRDLGVTQEELANSIGVTQGQISHFVTGQRRLQIEDIKKLCMALDISSDWLLFGKINIKPQETILKKDAMFLKKWSALPLEVKRPIMRLIETLSKKK